jgi:hypothetical protein
MHPAIGIIDSRFADLATTDALSQRADQQNHGALTVGPRGATGIAPLIGASIIAWTVSAHGCAEEAGILAWIPIASYLSTLTPITVITTFFTPENRGRDLDDPRDAADAP